MQDKKTSGLYVTMLIEYCIELYRKLVVAEGSEIAVLLRKSHKFHLFGKNDNIICSFINSSIRL